MTDQLRSVFDRFGEDIEIPGVVVADAVDEERWRSLDIVQRAEEELRGEGQTVMFVAIDGRLGGLVGVADPINESVARSEGRARSLLQGRGQESVEN